MDSQDAESEMKASRMESCSIVASSQKGMLVNRDREARELCS